MKECQSQFDALWGGVIADQQLDLVRGSLRLDVDVTESEVTSHHSILFSGISELYNVRIPEDWDYAELTSITVAPQPKGQRGWVVKMVLWREVNLIKIQCAEITLDGKKIAEQSLRPLRK